MREYKKKHGRSAGKAGGSTETAAADAVMEADSVAKIQRQATGASEMSPKDDVEGQVRGAGRACAVLGQKCLLRRN